MPAREVRVLAAGGTDAKAVAGGLTDRLVISPDGSVSTRVDATTTATPHGWRDIVNIIEHERWSEAPAVLLLSLLDDLDTPANDFLALAERLFDLVAQRADCHVLVLLLSTLDGQDVAPVGRMAPAHRAARLDLAALELSSARGVSIVDADRIVAEMGGRDHVSAIGQYSPVVTDRLVTETLRILEYYRFFEDGSPIPQFEAAA